MIQKSGGADKKTIREKILGILKSRMDHLIEVAERGSVSFFLYLSHLFLSLILSFLKGHLYRQVNLLGKFRKISGIGSVVFLMHHEGFVIVAIIVILIDKVMDAVFHGEGQHGSGALEFYSVDLVDIDGGQTFFVGTVCVHDGEVFAELFFCAVGLHQLFGFGVGDFADLFLVGLSPWVVDVEVEFAGLLVELAFRYVADEYRPVRVVLHIALLLCVPVVPGFPYNCHSSSFMDRYKKRRTFLTQAPSRPARYSQLPGVDCTCTVAGTGFGPVTFGL